MAYVIILISLPIILFGFFACGYADSGPGRSGGEIAGCVAILAAGLALGGFGAIMLGAPRLATIIVGGAITLTGLLLVTR